MANTQTKTKTVRWNDVDFPLLSSGIVFDRPRHAVFRDVAALTTAVDIGIKTSNGHRGWVAIDSEYVDLCPSDMAGSDNRPTMKFPPGSDKVYGM
jgi:hypothetical protein